MLRERAACLAAMLGAGCMAQSRVAEVTIRDAGGGQNAPRAVPDQAGELAKLGPLTWVRGIEREGGLTPWHQAGDLWVSDLGLVREPVRLATLETARASGLDAEAQRWLEELKPRDGRAQVTNDRAFTTLHVSRADSLVPWIVRFLARAQAAGKPLGTWQLTDEAALGGIAASPVVGGPLEIDPRELLASGDGAGEIRAGHGIRWPDGGGFELEYFDAGKSAFALVPLVPLALVAGIVYAAIGGGSFIDNGGDDAAGGGPTLVLAPAVAARATPLFTASARRRSFMTVVAAGDVGATVQGDARGGLSLTVRMTELLELGAFARGVSAAAIDGGAGRTERLVAGGRLGLHVSLGPASAWSVVGGADIGAAVAGPRLRMAGFYAGVRRALGAHAFVGIQPLVPVWFSGDERVSGTRLRWMPSLEIGAEM